MKIRNPNSAWSILSCAATLLIGTSVSADDTELLLAVPEVLAQIPEAGYEMGVYAWWWGTQDRDDLAARAAEMAERLP